MLIVPDLAKHPKFKSRPYVCGPPYYRFYAGASLKTANGIVIGALCALDYEPRHGLSKPEQQSLTTVAKLVMEYFENMRAAADRDKITTMYKGLNTFVAGSSKQRKGKVEADERARSGQKTQLNDARQDSGATTPRVHTDLEEQVSSVNFARNGDAMAKGGLPNDASERIPLKEQFQATLKRAANLLAESLALESGGVVFYDPVTVVGIVAESKSPSVSPLHECSEIVWGDEVLESANARATVLAEKLAVDCGSSSPLVTPGHQTMTTRILASLIEQFPTGCIWEFDEHGIIPGHRETWSAQWAPVQGLGAYLSGLFPGARSLIFVPLFDANAGTHYSGCFAWSTDATNRFAAEVEFSFVKAFGNNVSAEINQLATLDADRAKSDFISSISHELRTPMHGIMNAVDAMMMTSVTSLQSGLLTTIGNSTKTLLDTITHVLDFSKINHSSRRPSRILASGTESDLQPHDNDVHTSAVDISAITEQVVDSINASTMFSRKQPSVENAPNSHVDTAKDIQVFLDISADDWLFRTEAGAIGRVVMNIFGNALKYTERGSITVRLFQSANEVSSHISAEGTRKVVLIVKDTGKGISSEFLKHGLFQPFTQESQLNEGTGLGMSIVLKTVKELHGDVTVRSSKGQGTEVHVVLPSLPRASSADWTHSTSDDLEYLRGLQRPLTVGLYGFDPERQMSKLLRKYIEGWIHAECVCDWTYNKHPQIMLVDVLSLPHVKRDFNNADFEIIVLCDSPIMFEKLQEQSGRYHFLLKTFGPHRLAAAIRECIDRSEVPMEDVLHGQPHLENYAALDSAADSPLLLTPGECATPTRTTENASQPILRGPDEVKPSHQPERPKLPTIDTDTRQMGSASERATAMSKAANRQTRVLVVDDNSVNRHIIAAVLRRNGIHTDEAENGLLALQAAKAVAYDVIIMDINMPVMDGHQATREIRKYEKMVGRKEQVINADETGLRTARRLSTSSSSRFGPADLATPPGSPEEDEVMTDVEDDSDEDDVKTPTVLATENAAIIIASTAQNDPENQAAGLKNGFDVWLTKPFITKQLGPMITTWMETGLLDLSKL